MNFDNKAVVINSKVTRIESINGSAFCYNNRVVAPPVPFVVNSSDSYIYENISNVYKQDENNIKNNAYVTGIKSFGAYILTKEHLKIGYEPFCTYILPSYIYGNKKLQKYNVLVLDYTRNKDTDRNFFYTRIIEKTAESIENTKRKSLPYVKAIIKYDKEITPININSHDNITVVVQKNEYFEIITEKLISMVKNLPESMGYTSKKIYGTMLNSGEVKLTVQYMDGDQIIIINAPYYRRTL